MVQSLFSLELEKAKQSLYDPLIPTSKLAHPTPDPDLIIASPYPEPAHLLRLSTLSRPYRLLAQSLTHLRPLTPTYATIPYKHAFNWPEIISSLASQLEPDENFEEDFFIIVFRSQVPVGTSRPYLGILDREAHVEATRAGGLLKYWFGVVDGEGRNLAT